EVEDLGSRNGVLVDGMKITKRTPLPHGAVLGIGNARLVVLDSDRRRDQKTAQVTPSKPIARVASSVGKQVSSIQGTLVGVSLAALVFRARAALHTSGTDDVRDAAEKLAAQLEPGLAVERDLADEAVRAFTQCALALVPRAPTSAE